MHKHALKYVFVFLVLVFSTNTVDATISYDASKNTVYISNEITNISTVASTINNPAVITRVKPGEYLLNANLIIRPDATLKITSEDIDYLKIKSTRGGIYYINNTGTMIIDRVEISSWNTADNAPDKSVKTGKFTTAPRSYIIAAWGSKSHANVTYSKIHHLGYEPNGLHYNGLSDARYRGIVWISSSNNLISNNNFADDMLDGITLWEKSNNNIIKNNTVSNTYENGILAYHYNEYNLIENNTVRNAGKQGIELFSNNLNNIIRNNYVDGTGHYGIYLQSANKYNTIEKNTVKNLGFGGIRLYSGSSSNRVTDNVVYKSNLYGIHINRAINSVLERNIVTHGKSEGIYIDGDSGSITVQNNIIAYNSKSGILSASSGSNTIKNNIITNNQGYGISGTGMTSTYNDVWNNNLGNYNRISQGKGDISLDPLFADPQAGDYHLKSRAGRWTPAGWVIDSVSSPAIDAGDPTFAYSNEPSPNGGRINMGAHGNTPQASRSGALSQDTVPPSAITNLAAGDPTIDSITLTWTAPGDDGNIGTASQYDIRYSTSVINESNWNSATQVTGEITPAPAGTTQTIKITGLNSGTTYYFAIRTADDVPNWSGLSNVPDAATVSDTKDLTVSNITVSSGKSYAPDTLAAGKLQYIDRSYTFSTVPSPYEGLRYIRTANDDKASNGSTFLEFDTISDMTVYIAHDDRISSKPSWLLSFTDTGDKLISDGGTFSIYARNFSAGHVELGGNDGDGYSMYSVILRPFNDSMSYTLDVNLDGSVDVADLVIVSQHLGETTAAPYPRYDVNADGIVDITDVTLVADHI
ncbi:nitrous oxidase accessory protein [Candidatus Methanoperedens nitroreducens]|uniref:Probable pectate lyase C n=1 Tax=Candidatus Methanoperedens nitratireducens TaxID=1392998 RepID=A0A062V4M6_9EURY|nr:right-handed parallel beta-helix repeat-containing protein [Candidatus Methanoperedens nitroreducens]KCZ72292.1 nitrous oxidase accessory protein [Candidatus Methanoperedens nitroreducens]MDJ1420757.1 right-handed parallel beta-helix repeat-containing protein [Candidatus Methanoperedens sp.]